MNKLIPHLMTAVALLTMSLASQANNSTDKLNPLPPLTSLMGKAVVQDKSKLTHLVFIDVWRSYEGKGDEEMINALPHQFLKQSQKIWIQPDINVTKAQLVEFQQYFSQVTPLVVDKKFVLMRAFNIWQSPYHVLLKGNKEIFSGDASALSAFVSKKYTGLDTEKVSMDSNPIDQPMQKIKDNTLSTDLPLTTKVTKPKKPLIGDMAPKFTAKTLTGVKVSLSDELAKLTNQKPLNLIFLDALCPMPHFPDCEDKIAQLNKRIKADSSQQWLGVVNSYYVNEEYAQGFVSKFALTLPVIFDHNNKIYRAYDVYASPYQIKINHQGIIESRSDSMN